MVKNVEAIRDSSVCCSAYKHIYILMNETLLNCEDSDNGGFMSYLTRQTVP